MPFLDRDGVRLQYWDLGSGDPVVLVHGFTSSFERNWVDTGWVERLLGEGFRVVGLDVRCHGGSTRCYLPVEVETNVLAHDVVALLDERRIPRAHVVGFSMGGGIALELALRHAARVETVVVAGIGDKAMRERQDADELTRLADALRATTVEEIEDELGRRLRTRAEAAGNDTRALAALVERGGWPGDVSRVGPSAVPVLVVVATRDEYMAGADALVRTLRARQLVVDAAHTEVIRRPDVMKAAVVFLRNSVFPRPRSEM